jgi:hypothetical protein
MTTSWGQAQASRYSELAALWARADSLDEKELTRLCLLVSEILSGCSKANLASTDMEIEDLIQSFIAEKILYPLQTAPDKFKRQMPTSHGALIMYFQRVVTSRARTSESRLKRRSEGLEVDVEAETESETRYVRPEVENAGHRPGTVERLYALGFAVEALVSRSERFVGGLAPLERDVLCNFFHGDLAVAKLFPDSPRLQAEARLATAQLGLWRGNTAGRNVAAFANTRIGRFMSQAIGEPLDASHIEAIEALMGLLCDVACNKVS